MKGTKEQKQSYEALKNKWAVVDKPVPMIGDEGVWMVRVGRKSESPHYTSTLWVGIEPDGYTHS